MAQIVVGIGRRGRRGQRDAARTPPERRVVGDDDAVRDSLRFLLEVAGYAVLTFGSAGEFLSSADVGTLACVLVDQHLTQVTGLELVARIRVTRPELPVALLTGSPSAELTRRAFELRVTDLLEKPLREQGLLQFVERAAGNVERASLILTRLRWLISRQDGRRSTAPVVLDDVQRWGLFHMTRVA